MYYLKKIGLIIVIQSACMYMVQNSSLEFTTFWITHAHVVEYVLMILASVEFIFIMLTRI